MRLTIITVRDKGDYENWRTAESEYVSFVDPYNSLTHQYFEKMLEVFSDRPLFRKLSMVSPSVDIETESPIFGWLVSPTSVIPSRIKSSTEPYAGQVGYLHGAIIKKSALERLQPVFTGAILHDSINLSLDMWNAGHRVFIHPGQLVDTMVYADAIKYQPEVDEKVKQIWKREMVG